jgi:UDP-N-acetylglucosamine kinase
MSDISDKALQFIRSNRKLICDKFANPDIYLPADNPFTIFMAGEPGAGKTEFSKSYIKELVEKVPDLMIARIDPDEVRKIFVDYTGNNSHEFQRACGLAVDYLFDHIQKKKINAVIDGTFVDYDKQKRNIERALNRGRKVEIYFIYQNPKEAWNFTKIREVVEQRHISKSVFIEAYLKSKENVNKIKKEFGSKIEVSLVIKNVNNMVEKTHFNIDNLDSYLRKWYNREDLERIIEE